MEDNYEDIINLPHYEPKKHQRMSQYNRSAQFAPFAALTGYDDQVKETARLTNKRVELSDELKEVLSFQLLKIDEMINDNLEVEITYFIPDDKKDGGKYVIDKGIVKRIDFVNRFIKFTNNKKIILDDIIDIKSDILLRDIVD